jgi:putative tryptophan/tyrosine transport system substrate-binding protein
MILRREFIALLGGAAAAWPVGARAQQPAMPAVGFLSGRSLASDADLVAVFRRALGESGFVEGQNVAIEFRWADGRLDQLPALAAELIERKVAVLFAGASESLSGALRVAAASIPVVFATGSDPVAANLIASLNRPGGNLTGVTVITAALWPKRLELLRELISPTPVIALLVNPNNINTIPAIRELNDAARKIGQDVVVLDADAEREFEPAFASLTAKRASALVVADDALFSGRRARLVDLAARHAVPAIYGRREYPDAGGLISYGASTVDQYYRSGLYVGRILRGARPAELPFLQPTKFELVLNLKTAKALSLTVPPSLLARADEVIE